MIATITLIPANGAPGIVSAEGRLTTCSWDIGGPAPEGFWIFAGGQRLLNTAGVRPGRRPAGARRPRAGGRRGCWSRSASSSSPGFSIAIEATQLALARIDRACDVTDVIDNVDRRRDRRRHRHRAGAGAPPVAAIAEGTALAASRLRRGPRDEHPSAPSERRGDPAVRRGQAADGPTRDDVVQALLEREPLPAAARRDRGRAGRRRGDEPLPRHGQHRAVRRARRTASACRPSTCRSRPARSG